MATDLERLVVSLEASLTKFQRQMDNAGQVADRGTKKAAVAADRNLKTIEDRAGKAAANINRSLDKVGSGRSAGLQNFSFQLQDIIVQVQGGTSAVRALSQQLPQMLGGFGPMGAVAGVAVGLLGGLVTQLDLFGGAAILSADQLAKLNDELDSNKEAAQAAAGGYDALIAKLATFTELQKAAFVVQQQNTLSGELKELETQIATVSGSIKSNISDIRRQMVEMFGGNIESPELLLLRDRFQELKKELDTGKLSSAGYVELRDILTQIAKTAGPELQATLRGITDQIVITGAKAEDYAQKQRVTQAVVETVNGAINTNNKVLVDQRAKLGEAADAADTYAGSLRGAAAAMGGLSGAPLLETRPRPTTGLAFGSGSRLPDRPGVLGQAFPGVDPGSLALDKLANDFLNPGSSTPPKPKAPKAPKKTAAEKAAEKSDNRLDALQREIELNTKLLAAYALGDEAMAKIKAQYDAVNSARQIGLKEGTAEYTDYLTKAQAAEAENAALEAKLKLMGQGKSLTAEMRTEQEALNAKLAEYKAQLDAGAISQTTYERAVAKAKDQNAGYAEGIQAIGDAIEGGIQGATSFNDALLKIGLSLAKLVLQAALFGDTAGGGPLGKIFSGLTGLAGGLVGGFGGGSAAAPGIGAPGTGGSMAAAYGSTAAAGGMQGPGLVKVGENGPELLSLSQRGHVTPANATRRLVGGGGGSSQPINFNISLAGANGDRAVAAIAEAAVKRGLAQVPEINRQHRIRFSPT